MLRDSERLYGETLMSSFSPRLVLERKGRACMWCKSVGHKPDDCKYKPKNAALQERIAERQSRSWEPRIKMPKY